MLEGLIVALVMCGVFGISIGSIVNLWFGGSIFESIHEKLFSFCYEENEASQIVKRPGWYRFPFRGLTCDFCFAWELSLVASFLFKLNVFTALGFAASGLVGFVGTVLTSSIILWIAYEVHARMVSVREEIS